MASQVRTASKSQVDGKQQALLMLIHRLFALLAEIAMAPGDKEGKVITAVLS